MEACEITVVIPTFDRWHLLAHALTAALSQQDVDLEVVIVDDASSTTTPSPLLPPDSPVRIVRHAENSGVARARNTGLAAARGKWVAFLDDDDLWSPRKLRKQLDAALGHEASFVYSAVVALDQKGRVVWTTDAPEPTTLLRRLLARNTIPAGSSNVMARADLLKRVGGFDEAFGQLADWDLWIRLAAEARAAACDEVLVGYVEHADSMLLTRTDDVFRELELIEGKHQDLRDRMGTQIDRAAFSAWVAAGQRRAGRRAVAALTCLRSGLRNRSVTEVVGGLRLALSRQTQPLPSTPPEWLKMYGPARRVDG